MSQNNIDGYGLKEELANTITHGLGVIVGAIGLVMLVEKAFSNHSDTLTVISVYIYGISIVALFLASTLYHYFSNPRVKAVFKTLDHCAIFLLIAGSYTPFLMISLRTPLAIGLMVTIWLIALLGIIFKLAIAKRFSKFSLFSYLAMGWLSLVIIYQLIIELEAGGVILLGLGGVIYSLGAVFYIAKRIPFNHAIWHCFVLVGAICHFMSVYYYVLAAPAVANL